MKVLTIKMKWQKNFFYNFLSCLLFFYIINTSHACKPFDRLNFGNDQTYADIIKGMFEPLKGFLIPEYNENTVPNYKDIIEKFNRGKDNDDIYLNVTQLISKYGYPVETHEVTTDDDYVLSMHRIPNPGAPVVFLMHGVLCSSDDWITTGKKNSLAYGLADRGYDVWMGNNRGNKHSRKNLKISPDCGEFWEFSFDEIGSYDLPAMIDYALQKTGKSQLAYVGHSQGTTAFYTMLSEKPEYNEKISFMVCLSAVVYMKDVRSPLIQVAAGIIDELQLLVDLLGIYEVAPSDLSSHAINTIFCGTPELAEIFCESGLFLISGYDYPQLDAEALPVLFGHYPSGAAIRQGLHYVQEVKSGKFRKYDHGSLGNMARYGSAEPPEYPLEKVTCPQAVFYSNNDWLTSAPDIYKLLKELPNVVEFYHVACASFEHFDFLFAKDVDVLVNNEIYNLFIKYVRDE